MTNEDAPSALSQAVLNERIVELSRYLEMRAPGLLGDHPIADSAALIASGGGSRSGRGSRYRRLGADYTRLAETIEQRAGVEALEQYHQLLILHFTRELKAKSSTIVLPPSVESLLDAELKRMVAEMEAPTAGFHRLDNDLFLKDLGLARGILLPVGAELVDVDSGVPRRILMLGGAGQFLRGLYFFLVKLRGFSPLLEYHMDVRNLRDFTPDGWDRTYRRLSELLQRNLHIKGVVGTAWFYDPAMEWVSPHLAYIRRRHEEGGAWVFKGAEHADAVEDALAKSATRRKLYEQGRYRPRGYYAVWARADIIRWARALP